MELRFCVWLCFCDEKLNAGTFVITGVEPDWQLDFLETWLHLSNSERAH